MFWDFLGSKDPLGVRLRILKQLLEASKINVRSERNALIVRRDNYSMRFDVIPHDGREKAGNPIQAVVRVVADLPGPVREFLGSEEALDAFNALATLGAFTREGNRRYIGSRLTIYKNEGAWDTLQLPLLMFTAICGAEGMLGGLRRSLSREGDRGGSSSWTNRDLVSVAEHFAGRVKCGVDGLEFAATYQLARSESTPNAGTQATAVFQMLANLPHPDLGGGLFCRLHMPHKVHDVPRLQHLCATLNLMEMAAEDRPPHFGAWCGLEGGLSYVSFLHNALHSVDGIADNMAVWAYARALWANAVLSQMSIRT